MTYEVLLRQSMKMAEQKNKETEAVKFLLLETAGGNAHQFYLSMKEEVAESIKHLFLERLHLYIEKSIPIQHLLGYAYFFGYKFVVNDDVLIPRLETEQLVEHVLYYYDLYFNGSHIKTLDLGCGSGCIGLSLKKEENQMDLTLTDISEKALVVAEENAKNLDVNATFILSDLFKNIEGKFDIIVSNPPYIPQDEDVMDIVKKEPSVALYGGTEGLDFYEKILAQAKDYIQDVGLIAFEHGYQHKEKMHQLASFYFPNENIVQLKDLQGKDRFTFIGLGGVLDEKR